VLDRETHNAPVNQSFSAEQSDFAGSGIVRGAPDEIKGCCDATRAACGTEIANISTNI